MGEVKKRLFVDMDGTLAVFKPTSSLEELYEKGYFENLEPHKNVVAAVKEINKNPNIELYILSAYLTDSKYAYNEKVTWLKKYLPDIKADHYILMPCGKNKLDYVPEGIRESDVLLDDYSLNLSDWDPPARGLKFLNGINGTKGTWKGERVSIVRSEDDIARAIEDSVLKEIQVYDDKPNKIDVSYERMSEIADAALDILLAQDSKDNFEELDNAVNMTAEEIDYFNINPDLVEKHIRPNNTVNI